MIEEIKNQITSIFQYLPIKVISAVIYGSWARMENTKDSDIDMLIISNDINPKRQRRRKEIASIKEQLFIGYPLDILLLTTDECISNFKGHNPLFLDIALDGIILKDEENFIKKLIDDTKQYITQKGLIRYHDGWSFPVLFREATSLSEISNRDFAYAMLKDGEHDYEIGIFIMGKGYYDKAVYHFQQSIEKAIKAVLISLGEFKKTHFVGNILAEKLQKIEFDPEWKEKLYNIAKISNEIEPEITWSRYPGIDGGKLWKPYEEYNIDDAKETGEKSEIVIRISRDFISWWFNMAPLNTY